MTEFVKHRRIQLAEIAAWTPDFDMTGVSISPADREAGSPKLGDMIARNPSKHEDKWLVNAAYYETNFILVEDEAAPPAAKR